MKETIVIDYPHPEMVRIILNKPETDNAYDDELVCTLITAFDEFAQDDSLKLVWISAEGKNFSTGPDSDWQRHRMKSGRAEHQQDSEQLARLFHTLYQLPIPIVASVRGQANAAAVGILCCCDIVLACEHANFTIMELEYGQVPALQSPYLVKAIGERAARYYSFSGETMDCETAMRLGLVSKMVPDNQLDSVTSDLLQRLQTRKNLSLRQTKAMISLSANEVFDDSLVDTLIECSTDIRVSQSDGNSN